MLPVIPSVKLVETMYSQKVVKQMVANVLLCVVPSLHAVMHFKCDCFQEHSASPCITEAS